MSRLKLTLTLRGTYFSYASTGQFAGQIYSYPARRWRKRKQAFIPPPEVHVTKASDIETGEAGKKIIPVYCDVDLPSPLKVAGGSRYG